MGGAAICVWVELKNYVYYDVKQGQQTTGIMAKQFLGRDWRSPGDQWVHTASGWKRLLDTSTDGCERTEKDATSTDRASIRDLPHYVGVVEDWRPVIDFDDTYSGDSCQPENTGR